MPSTTVPASSSSSPPTLSISAFLLHNILNCDFTAIDLFVVHVGACIFGIFDVFILHKSKSFLLLTAIDLSKCLKRLLDVLLYRVTGIKTSHEKGSVGLSICTASSFSGTNIRVILGKFNS